MAHRMFYAAVGIQILQWLLSFFLGSEAWVLQGLFWVWLTLIPVIGFFAGRDGSGIGKAGGLAALLGVTWFFMVALNAMFLSSTVSADNWLRGMGAFALSSVLVGSVAFLVAAFAALIGRRFRVQSSA